MKRKIINFIRTMGVLALAGFCLSACNSDFDVKQDFPFRVESLPVPKEIAPGETVEIRCSLLSEGNYNGTRYTIRYFQYDGRGVLKMEGNQTPFTPNDRYPLEKGDFRLYYTAACKKRQSIEIVIEDNHGQKQTMEFDFNNKQQENETS